MARSVLSPSAFRRVLATLVRSGTCVTALADTVLSPWQSANGQTLKPMSRRDTVSPLSMVSCGASSDWDPDQIVRRDGSREPLSFGLYEVRPQEKQPAVFVIASHAPNEQERAVFRQLQSFRPLPAGAPRCKLSVMRIDTTGKVLGYKETGIGLGELPPARDHIYFDYAYDSSGVPPSAFRGAAVPS